MLVYDYYGLDIYQISLIEDTINYIIPAMQPRQSAELKKIWDQSNHSSRASYTSIL